MKNTTQTIKLTTETTRENPVENKRKADLLEIARARGIKVYKSWTKLAIIQAILDHKAKETTQDVEAIAADTPINKEDITTMKCNYCEAGHPRKGFAKASRECAQSKGKVRVTAKKQAATLPKFNPYSDKVTIKVTLFRDGADLFIVPMEKAKAKEYFALDREKKAQFVTELINLF